MRKTGGEIETDVFTIVKASALHGAITGTVYKDGMRPQDATTEDAVVSFITGLDGEIQSGALNINIYVQDINNGGDGLVKNGARCRALEVAANALVQGCRANSYRFQLGSMIQTFKAEGINQHFINVRLKFQLVTF
jgi:hypothetical protein